MTNPAEIPIGPTLETALDRMTRASNFLSNGATLVSEYGRDPMDTLPLYMRTAERMIDEAREAFVGMMRENGASWTEVGAALGVTKQAAYQRYAEVLDRANAVS